MSTDRPYGDIRARLIELRKAAGLRQCDVAERMYVTRTAVSFYESGRRVPSADRLADWAKAVGAEIRIDPIQAVSTNPRTTT